MVKHSSRFRSLRRRVRRAFGTRRRRHVRKSKTSGSFLSNQTRPQSSNRYKARRPNRRTMIRSLYRSSQFHQHWRSIGTSFSGSAPTTGATIGQAVWYAFPSIPSFWTTGVQPIDIGSTIPSFGHDVFLRGGMLKLNLSYDTIEPSTVFTNKNTVKASIFGIWAKAYPNISLLPVNGTVVNTDFDPTLLPDFQGFGKVMFRKDIYLDDTSNMTGEITFRLHAQRIDQAVYVAGGTKLWWVFIIGPTNTPNAATPQPSLNYFMTYNVSFVGDQSTT
ncbi:capsid protein [Capybara virus 10_cap1_55]|uniref:Capsid protein n=1 Tax=Capybara virus 10_cap1_55 TaxID=2585037 RepID=A0A514TRV0_9VIRU|nr:capsid protein [Capybara virus 10_cap1_55]